MIHNLKQEITLSPWQHALFELRILIRDFIGSKQAVRASNHDFGLEILTEIFRQDKFSTYFY